MNLVVTIDSVKHAESLMDKIKLLEHVIEVEIMDEEMLNIAEERMEEYRINPNSTITLEELKTLFKNTP